MDLVVAVCFVFPVVLCFGHNISNNEIKRFSEEIFYDDVNNAGRYILVAPQGRADPQTQTDNAPLPLLTVDNRAYKIPTISKLIKLYDNYDPDVRKSEVVTSLEKEEEMAFLDTILGTSVMTKTKSWLSRKGLASSDNVTFKKFLHDLWFGMYSRQRQNMGSSGFEHTFLGEIKNNIVSGLHNWVFFSHEEKRKQLNYLGWTKKLDFPDNKGAILKLIYTWGNVSKPVGSMLVGPSPEFEMSLYTLCYLSRPNTACPISLGGKTFAIQTWVLDQHNKKFIGSAYPIF